MSEKNAPRTRMVAAIAVVALAVGGVAGYLLGDRPTVSEQGQVSYACALAEHIRDSHPNEDDWGPIDEDPAWNELQAIPALLGLSAPQQDGEDNPFAEIDWSFDRLPAPDELLDPTIAVCEER